LFSSVCCLAFAQTLNVQLLNIHSSSTSTPVRYAFIFFSCFSPFHFVSSSSHRLLIVAIIVVS
jgi:hypothetical protein